MIQNNEDRFQLIEHRLQQASETIEEVQFQIENSKYLTAVNRIYYGVFYALTALALFYKYETSKHLQLIGWFNKEFVNTPIFDKKYSRILKQIFESRQKGDYEPFVNFSQGDVNDLFMKMKDFIATIERHIIEKNLIS